MDVENDNFYDEISSFLPQPEDYCLEDLEEIIRSTETNLDASLDINIFADSLNQHDFDIPIADTDVAAKMDCTFLDTQQLVEQQNQMQNNFANDNILNFSTLPSPAVSEESAVHLSPYETPGRTSSPISLDGDRLNPNDFINFFDDDIETDDIKIDNIVKLNENCRNTPSPTGSYTSSTGSSTSGVQSDACSEASMSQSYECTINQDGDDELLEFIKFKNHNFEQNIKQNEYFSQRSEQQLDNDSIIIKEEDVIQTSDNAATTLVPIAVPVLPITSAQNIQPVNIMQGTLIPIHTVPLTPINPVVNVISPTTIQTEDKLCSNKSIVPQPIKLLNTATISADGVGSNVTRPANPKPKTIYLSSNDFKTLMSKMNGNGKKITGGNGQIPKMIMKTANGKVIAANTITNFSKSNLTPTSISSTAGINNTVTPSKSHPQPYVSKIIKASDATLVTQQPPKVTPASSRSTAAMTGARSSLNHVKAFRSDFTMLKGFNDDKILKKQLRMLKNRESASLSRKKKKEYIERLENRISNLEKENYSLKAENSSLRSQLMAFAQTCNCKNANVSEFILNTLNMDDKSGRTVLNLMNNAKRHLDNSSSGNNYNMNGTVSSTKHHVKIAPKPSTSGSLVNKSVKHRMNAASVKKNVAVLFAMAFMVTLNVGNFQQYLNKSTLESNEIDASVTGAKEETVVQNGRRLLWVANENEFYEQANRIKRDTEKANMPPPPLHFLRPINRTTADKMNGSATNDEPFMKRSSPTKSNTTVTYGNSTQENMRLARNLHKWIGGNDYLNLTGTINGNEFDDVSHFKFGSGSYMGYDLPLQAPIGTKQKRKIVLDSQSQGKHTKMNIKEDPNSLDIYKPRISEEYLRLFKGIKRQDDTFYVLSFNMDHILLPASAYNKSSRPKMSLMLPAGDPSHNGDIVLMQIDCEVINTTELEIKSHMIPEKLRPSKYTANVRGDPSEVSNNNTSSPASINLAKPKDLPLKRQDPSAPRTYFMMGPKNQASPSANSIDKDGNILKRKAPIVKLNANHSVIGSGVLNIRNLSLFSRMREAVGAQTNDFNTTSYVKN